jgi:hypothetical protein
MATLNEIATLLAERAGRQFNQGFKEEMKFRINQARTRLIKNSLEKHPEDRKYFYQTIIIKLESTKGKNCEIKDDCLMRTIDLVPKTIRVNSILFDYVGTSDMITPFGYALPEQVKFFKFSKYTGKNKKYSLLNERIYIFNDQNIREIGIRGIFADPNEVNKYRCSPDVPCIPDDEEYPMPPDLVDTLIIYIMDTFFKMPGTPNTEEVNINENAKD